MTGVSANPNTERDPVREIRTAIGALASATRSGEKMTVRLEAAMETGMDAVDLLARALRLASERISEYEDEFLNHHATPESVLAGLLREAGKT